VVGAVAVAWMFSEEQLEQLRSFPDIGRDDLIRYFTLTRADVGFVGPGRGRGPADRLGLAVQLCTLPWLGFVPDEVSSAPPVAVARLAERLGLDPGVLEPQVAPRRPLTAAAPFFYPGAGQLKASSLSRNRETWLTNSSGYWNSAPCAESG
jgi:hypothetical protein